MPYHTGLNATFLIMIALLYVSIIGCNFSGIAGPNYLTLFSAMIYLMVTVPLLYLTYAAICWTLSRGIFAKVFFKRFQARIKGYETLASSPGSPPPLCFIRVIFIYAKFMFNINFA